MPTEKRHPGLRWGLFAVGCIVIGAVIAHTPDSENTDSIQSELLSINESTSDETGNSTLFTRLSQPLALPENLLTPVVISQIKEKYADWQSVTVKSGDSLSSLFDRADITPDQLIEFMALKNAVKHLIKIHPGETIKLNSDNFGLLNGLHYDIDFSQSLLVERINGELQTTTIEHNIEARPHHLTGVINDSLFMSAQEAGLTDNMTMELAAIFGWDIDF
ncbi:MAG: LysM peptidoglycan-binding domain-containing protein, partial [Gammaproteobacteria bacterium]|nr:LysM peptidoglycan-binding domain-containing protein [Gammaproteobacteria bacterium]